MTFIQQAYLKACLSELEALKPGNVHLFADGHGMAVQDFIDSAEASAPALCDDGTNGVRSLGQRMLHALVATHARVGCNTNLGIVLLAGPIVHAVLHYPGLTLQTALGQVLQQTSRSDAEAVHQSIRLVKPAGMGHHDQHDVAKSADISLLEAMRIASVYDSIGRMYVTDYHELFAVALPLYADCCERWQRPAWALTAVYLYWLSSWPDSHIVRKYGQNLAEKVQQQATEHFQHFCALENPKLAMADLLNWDTALKQQGVNPGTSADLTVATALVSQYQALSGALL